MKNTLKNNKGFTLIEIVIVIVIIAILAAILVPSMIAWIDRANERTVTSAADTLRNTVSAEILELYKDGESVDGTQANACYDSEFWESIRAKSNADVQCTDPTADQYLTFTVSGGGITTLSYTDGDWTAVYENDTWTCTKN